LLETKQELLKTKQDLFTSEEDAKKRARPQEEDKENLATRPTRDTNKIKLEKETETSQFVNVPYQTTFKPEGALASKLSSIDN
jgi:hypothetical protein